ncbi:hypothetical protein Taro_011520 [Colocasia esculenta]|uniref:GDU1 n=1 Tax=Colocasia esculenta TaxID=4460 RepID=A0A843U6H4_COLES|nr:hypothetical protein [Colocasia esculenta]
MRAVSFFDSPTAMGTSSHQPAPAGAQQQHSTWRSPVPYLFGGLAAMMGLIAFALLLLACSYWRLSGYLEEGGGAGNGTGDLESAGSGKPDDAGAARVPPPPPDQRIVVIMAGDEKPTFLATPASSRASSFGDNANRGRAPAGDDDNKIDEEANRPETAAGGNDGVSERQQEGTPESQEDAHQNHDREGVHENL